MVTSINYLSKRILLALLVLSVGLISCKKGGGVTGTDDSDTKTEEPQEITSSFASEETSFLPGEIQFITIEGHSLQEDEYDATIANGMEVTLYRYSEDADNKTLVFISPEEDSGNHELLFEIEGQEQSLKFEIVEYEVIEDPVEFVTNNKDLIADQLTDFINQVSDENTKKIINDAISDLDKAMEDFSSLDEIEQKQIAYIIKENIVYSLANKSYKSINNCDAIGSNLTNSPLAVFTAATTGVIGRGLGGLAGAVLSIFGTASVYDILSQTIDDIDFFISNCIAPELSIESMNKAKQSYSFNHAESRSFSISLRKTLTDELIATVEVIKTSLGELLSVLPESWVEYLFENDFNTVEPVDAELLSLNISDTEISGELTVVDESASLTFIFDESSNPTETQEFIFTLSDNEDLSLDVEASLNPPLPIAYEAQLSVKIDSVVTDTLQADYAATFAIQNTPSNGTLTLEDENSGEFSYEPNEGFEGSDSFTFTASNSTGSSETATVLVDIFDEDSNEIPIQLHGFWEYEEEYTNYDDSEGYAIEILEITSNSILNHIYESYKECWEGPYNEMDPNNPGDREGETYTYYSEDALEKVTLSIEASQLKMELTADPSTYILIPETDRDMDSLYPICDE